MKTTPLPVLPSVESQAHAAAGNNRRFRWQRFGGKFLVLSVLAHLAFAALATYLVVYTIHAKRAAPFQAGPRGSAASRSVEHKVKVQKQKSSFSAPPQAKRITSTGVSKVALPEMPAMPSLSTSVTPKSLSGMGNNGLTAGSFGTEMGGMGGVGGPVTFFGARTASLGLVGNFYDLKQTPTRQSTDMTPVKMQDVMSAFLRGNFDASVFAGYFKAPKSLYTTQLFTPVLDAALGPAAFQMANEVKPRMWVVHYKGSVIPPESGTYSFIGFGDDYLIVKFNGRIVLDGSISGASHKASGWNAKTRYTYAKVADGRTYGVSKGDPVVVTGGQTYPMEIIIGEQPGGIMMADLWIEKTGVTYKKDEGGTPILPIFRLANTPPVSGGKFLPHDDNGPVWKAAPPERPETSVFKH